MACSRPPPPTTRTFMVAMRRRRRPGFLVSRTPLNSESLLRLHELEVVPLRIFECHDASPRINYLSPRRTPLLCLGVSSNQLGHPWSSGSRSRASGSACRHYGAAGPAAFEANSAADTVVERSIAVVSGPTPPGTGEVAF